MKRAERKIIAAILSVKPYLYSWQDEIEEEQEQVISDLSAPAAKTVEALIALDNKRIDLCNLNVLYGFIERELGAAFSAFSEFAASGVDSPFFDAAKAAIGRAGYDIERARTEFAYLFKRVAKRSSGVKTLGKNRSDGAFAVL